MMDKSDWPVTVPVDNEGLYRPPCETCGTKHKGKCDPRDIARKQDAELRERAAVPRF